MARTCPFPLGSDTVRSGHARFPIAPVENRTYPFEGIGLHTFDFPIGGFSPPEGRLARGFKPPAFSRFLFQSAVKSAESF